MQQRPPARLLTAVCVLEMHLRVHLIVFRMNTRHQTRSDTRETFVRVFDPAVPLIRRTRTLFSYTYTR